MNFVKSTALLKKIAALHDSATAFDGQISRMERDLILQYLRDLYEVISDTDDTPAPPRHEAPKAAVPEVVSRLTPPPVENVMPEPEILESEPILNNEKPKDEPKIVDEELLKLFAISESNDISSRLGSLPISDLSKAMGINDRILVKNDLFGGDQSLMDQTMSKLNSLATYDEAKTYLIHGVAVDQKWKKSSRVDRAASFIKLVKRRYL